MYIIDYYNIINIINIIIMKTLLSLKPLIANPLEIYKYNKVILNDSMADDIYMPNILKYIYKIFYNKVNNRYLKSFKYFIKICENIEYPFIQYWDFRLIFFLSFVINQDKYYKNIKKLVIYIIKKYKSLEIYTSENDNDNNILFYFNPTNMLSTKMSFKIYKYLLSLNIYYAKYNTYYETPPYEIILNNRNKKDLLIIKIQNQQEIWRNRRLFILLCIL